MLTQRKNVLRSTEARESVSATSALGFLWWLQVHGVPGSWGGGTFILPVPEHGKFHLFLHFLGQQGSSFVLWSGAQSVFVSGLVPFPSVELTVLP